MRSWWTLRPDLVFLNHGSFGACPRPVLEAQSALRAELEREPVRFLGRELEPRLDAARARLAAFLGADARDLVFVPNATTAVNAVLRALALEPGDEIVVTSHGYGACTNAVDFVCARAGARRVTAALPFPIRGEDEVVEAVLGAVTPRTRLALVDHVTSPSALVLPVARLARELRERGVELLIDGAHAPGQVPVDLDATLAAYATGNAHKWLCAPKGAAYLHVRRDRQRGLSPWVTSHGATDRRAGRPRLWIDFDWPGTHDPTAALCIPAAIDFLESLLPGGIPALRARNHALALAGRDAVLAAVGGAPPAPDAMLGSMATIPLFDGPAIDLPSAYDVLPLQARLYDAHRIEVPILQWPAPGRRVVRISAQAYNDLSDYTKLAHALQQELDRAPGERRAGAGGR